MRVQSQRTATHGSNPIHAVTGADIADIAQDDCRTAWRALRDMRQAVCRFAIMDDGGL